MKIDLLKRRIHYPELYKLLHWFIKNTLDNYLDQNTNTTLKALKKDKPPKSIREYLFDYESNHKKREEILEALKIGL